MAFFTAGVGITLNLNLLSLSPLDFQRQHHVIVFQTLTCQSMAPTVLPKSFRTAHVGADQELQRPTRHPGSGHYWRYEYGKERNFYLRLMTQTADA
ncbi:hypothetical protein J4E08_21690 [Sagittula sp. NFXS13]|uniref:hypothetical protein n=1 Tax=Sagittula sp. NFXS13 TaxID=2819095 RepID=UPI0032E055BE